MADAVNYSLCKRINLHDRTAAPLYYALAQSTGESNIDWMSKRISQLCTVTRPDVVGVLAALQIVFIESVNMGRIVRLGDIGSFRISLRSIGAETKEHYPQSNIKKARILYLPGDAISNSLKSLNYQEVDSRPLSTKKDDDTNTGGGSGSGTGSGTTGGTESGGGDMPL